MATKKQQVAEVVEGLGLGLVALGMTRVSGWKLDIEFAFSHAWRQWPHAAEYPSIDRAPKPDNEFWIGVSKSDRRNGAVVVWQHAGGEYEIVVGMGHRTPQEAASLVSDRPLDQWVELASAFRDRHDENVNRRRNEE